MTTACHTHCVRGTGRSGWGSNKVSHKCMYCAKVTTKDFQCSRCKASKYCSSECQRSHWGQHEPLCSAIKQLEEQNNRSNDSQTIFATHATLRKCLQIAKLVGERCVVPCLINGNEVNVLYDTGAQVSVISHDWIQWGALPYWVILGMCGQNGWVFQAKNLRMGHNFDIILPENGWFLLNWIKPIVGV